ncbi:MAG: ABC transporter substrate-binding protein [Caldilineaceae bacterium]
MARHLPDMCFVLITLLALLLKLSEPPRPAETPAGLCGFLQTPPPAPITTHTVTLTVMTQANYPDCWHTFTPAKAAPQVQNYAIRIVAKPVNALYSVYIARLEQIARLHNAPDIVYLNQPDLRAWAERGRLISLDQCRSQYSEFADVEPSAWASAGWQGRTWGVPVVRELAILYYSKLKLREMGWPPIRINEFPGKIQRGEITLDNLLAIAEDAVAQHVVEPGDAFWADVNQGSTFLLTYKSFGGPLYDAQQDRLLINQESLTNTYRFYHQLVDHQLMPRTFAQPNLARFPSFSIWHSALAQGRVLFWQASTKYYDSMLRAILAPNPVGFLHERIGAAFYPAGRIGESAQAMEQGSEFYAVTADAVAANLANGRKQAACALLAKTLRPEIHAYNAILNGNLGVIQSQREQLVFAVDHPFRATILPYHQAAWSQPPHPQFGEYLSILLEFMLQSGRGEISPEQAATRAISTLQNQLGDSVQVR